MAAVEEDAKSLVAALLAVESYEAAAQLLGGAAVAPDANFCEDLWQTVVLWDQEKRPRATRLRRAFSYVQQYRYRTSADHLATPASRQFVEALAARGTQAAMTEFLAANPGRLDANAVEALFAARYYLPQSDETALDLIEQLGQFAAERLRLEVSHRPPGMYRYFIQQLYAAYQRYEMRELLSEYLHLVDPALVATVFSVMEALRGADQLTGDHVHFVESLAARLTEIPPSRMDYQELAAELYVYVAALFALAEDPTRQAQCLAQVGVLRGLRTPTDALDYLRAALQVADVADEVRLWLYCTLAEHLTGAPGDAGANIEMAIGYLDQAERLVHPETSPPTRATVKILFGRAYRYRLAGTRDDNVQVAVRCFREAAELCPTEIDAYPTATALAELGALIGSSVRLEDIQQGIELIEQGLALIDDRSPADLLQALRAGSLDVGTSLLEKAALHVRAHDRGAPGQLEPAQQAIERALEQPGVSDNPQLKAMALMTYGSVVVHLAELPPDAEAVLSRAVEVADAAPGRRDTAAIARFHLGQFYARQGAFERAAGHYRDAIAAFADEVEPALSSGETQVQGERQVGPIYAALVEVLLQLDRPEEALDCLERSKARSLGDMIAVREMLPAVDVPGELVDEYVQLRERKRFLETQSRLLRFGRRPQSQELADSQTRLPEVDYVIRGADVEELTYRKMLADLEPLFADVIRAIRQHDPEFDPGPRSDALSLAEIGGWLAPDQAAIELLTTDSATYLFVLTHTDNGTTALRVFRAPQASRRVLQEMAQTDWLGPYGRYREAVQGGSPQLRKLRAAWQSAIKGIGPRLGELLDFSGVLSHLADAGARKIVFLPYQLLHLLPLHLLPGARAAYLCDEYDISYAPSLAILKACQLRSRRGRSRGLLVQDPDNSLPYAALEVRLLSPFVAEPRLLVGPECTWNLVQSELPATHLFHYSGHAYFNPRSPLASALVLADRRLTLGEVMASSDLSASALVVLSACETNQVASFLPGDEYAGLPSGFLYAGASTVLGTLWVVEDVAGPLAMQEFYRQFVAGGAAPAEAFAAAIKRLRSVTADDLLAEFDSPEAELDPALDRLLTVSRQRADRSAPLFDHPEYWAAYTLVGRP